MSNINTARHTEVRIKIEGVDVTDDVNKYLLSFTYTDYDDGNSDDINITLDDRDGKWIKHWLNSSPQTNSAEAAKETIRVPKVGQKVWIKEGAADYDGTRLHTWVYGYSPGFTVLEISKSRPDRIVIGIDGKVTAACRASDLIFDGGQTVEIASSNNSALAATGGDISGSTGGAIKVGDKVTIRSGASDYDGTRLHTWVYSYPPGFTVLEISKSRPDRVVIGIDGKVTAAMRVSDLMTLGGNGANTGTPSNKGLTISAVIVKCNFNSDGKDTILDCGTFEADDISAKGPPQTVTIRATSLPYTSSIRNQLKNKAWENIRLSGIANEIAKQNGFQCMYLSDFDPMYSRKEQVKQSDISFLQSIATAAGVSLKTAEKMLVIFDSESYEKKEPVITIENETADILSYDFSTGLQDTAYSSCHVKYTNPDTGALIEYTYTPKNGGGSGNVLEINEKVSDIEEAKRLAMKRLRQKNKGENSARFSLVGNVGLVGGVTVNIKGFGFYDGKYIVDSASHKVSGGYTTDISCTKTLEGY